MEEDNKIEPKNPNTPENTTVIAIIIVESPSLSMVFSHLGFHIILCVCTDFSVIWLHPLHYFGAWINSLGNYPLQWVFELNEWNFSQEEIN